MGQRQKGIRTAMNQDATHGRSIKAELKRNASDMDVDEEENRGRQGVFVPWAAQASRLLRGNRRQVSRSPLRASIASPPATRQPKNTPVNSLAGQGGGFYPSSMDPKMFRQPFTLVSEKDVVVKKFHGSEDDHEPYIKWDDGIRK